MRAASTPFELGLDMLLDGVRDVLAVRLLVDEDAGVVELQVVGLVRHVLAVLAAPLIAARIGGVRVEKAARDLLRIQPHNAVGHDVHPRQLALAGPRAALERRASGVDAPRADRIQARFAEFRAAMQVGAPLNRVVHRHDHRARSLCHPVRITESRRPASPGRSTPGLLADRGSYERAIQYIGRRSRFMTARIRTVSSRTPYSNAYGKRRNSRFHSEGLGPQAPGL